LAIAPKGTIELCIIEEEKKVDLGSFSFHFHEAFCETAAAAV